MYIPKRYGQARIDNCPFCGRIGTTKNSQGVAVCTAHKDDILKDMKCVCGEWLDLKDGKFGPYFSCMSCGNISMKKAVEMNPPKTEKAVSEKKEMTVRAANSKTSEKKEITVTSDQLDFLY